MASAYESKPWLRNYPDWGPKELPAGGETALQDFKAAAASGPEKPAVYYFEHTITYGEIDTLSDGLAAAYSALGLLDGDRVVVDLQNVPQFLVATYAAWKLGAVVVPLNPMYKQNELAYFCEDSGAKIFVTLDEIAVSLAPDFLAGTGIRHIITTSARDMYPGNAPPPDMLQGIAKRSVAGTQDMLQLIAAHRGKTFASPQVTADRVAYLTYTSGTTGPPKGAMNTHGNIAFNARVYEIMQKIDQDDVVLGVAPLFHVTGQVAHLAIAARAAIPVILYYRFDAGETLKVIERWKATDRKSVV